MNDSWFNPNSSKKFFLVFLSLLLLQALFNLLKLNWISLLGEIRESFVQVPFENYFYSFAAYLQHFLFLACFLLSLWAIGTVMARVFRWVFQNPFEEVLFSFGLGMGILSTLTFLLASLHLLYRTLFLIILSSMTVTAFVFLVRRKELFFEIGSLFRNISSSFSSRLFLILIAVSMGVSILAMMLPLYFYDQLIYHYAIPNSYIHSGGFVNLSSNVHSAYPMGWEMLYLFMMILKDETAAQLVNVAALLGCLFAFAAFGRRNGRSSIESLLSMVIFVTMPMVVTDILWGGIDLGWCFFQLLSSYAIFIYLDSDEKNRSQWLILSALFSGWALTTKYLAVIPFLVNLALLAYMGKFSRREPLKEILKSGALYAVLALALFLPWCIKNFHYFGNPVYPLLFKLFPSVETGLDLASFYSDIHTISIGELFTKSGLPAIFLNYLKGGGPSAADYMGTPVLICGITFLAYRNDKNFAAALFYLVLFWFCMILNSTQIRFLMPALALLIMVGTRIPSGLSERKITKTLLHVSWFIALAVLLVISFGNVMKSQAWRVVFGLQAKSDYLSHEEPSGYRNPYYAAMETFNHLDAQSKILFIGEARTFYSPRSSLSSSAFDQQVISKWSNRCANGEELYRKIKSENVTHIFLNVPEALLLRKTYNNFKWTNQGMKVFNEFWGNHVEELPLIHLPAGMEIPEMHLYLVVPAAELKGHRPPVNKILELENQLYEEKL